MDDLVVCPSCRRHVRRADAACPFCRRAHHARAVAGVTVAGIAIAMASCAYGPPPPGEGGGGTASTSSSQGGGGAASTTSATGSGSASK